MTETSDSSNWTPGAGCPVESLRLGKLILLMPEHRAEFFAGENFTQEDFLLIPDKKSLCEDK